jgi:hypothetical protein
LKEIRLNSFLEPKKIETVNLLANKKEINIQGIIEEEVLLHLLKNAKLKKADNLTITKIIIVKAYKIKVKNS